MTNLEATCMVKVVVEVDDPGDGDAVTEAVLEALPTHIELDAVDYTRVLD